jgi:multicomponent Na+:H+ antiporter subunit G
VVLDTVGAVLLLLGLLLATIGLYGLLRMPDIFHQLHPAGLITGPAVIVVLLASVATGSAEIITSAALVMLFVLITSPLSTHAVAQAARRRPRRDREPSGQPRSGREPDALIGERQPHDADADESDRHDAHQGG